MWLTLSEDVWNLILSYLNMSERNALALTHSVLQQQVQTHTMEEVEKHYQRLLESMSRAHTQIETLIEKESRARRILESNTNKTVAQMDYNIARAWRMPIGTHSPYAYLEFDEYFTVFRADLRPPGEIFVTGFARLTEDEPQLGLSLDVGGISHHLVSTSKSASDAMEFAIIRGQRPTDMKEVRANINIVRPPKAKVWIYLCRGTKGFYLHTPKEAKRNRHEVALIGIPSEFIFTAIEIDVAQSTATGKFHINPFLDLQPNQLDMLKRLSQEIIETLTHPTLNL